MRIRRGGSYSQTPAGGRSSMIARSLESVSGSRLLCPSTPRPARCCGSSKPVLVLTHRRWFTKSMTSSTSPLTLAVTRSRAALTVMQSGPFHERTAGPLWPPPPPETIAGLGGGDRRGSRQSQNRRPKCGIQLLPVAHSDQGDWRSKLLTSGQLEIMLLMRSARMSIRKGLLSRCIPGSKWPFPTTAFSA